MKLPEYFEFQMEDDNVVQFRYDYDKGEDQWFDARAGVGGPGYPASVVITEVNFGEGWAHSWQIDQEIDLEYYEDKIMVKIDNLISDENARQDEAEYEYFKEQSQRKFDWE